MSSKRNTSLANRRAVRVPRRVPSAQGLVASQPGTYDPRIRQQRRFRFTFSATSTTVQINGSCLLNLIHHAATTTVSYPLFQAVRLMKVEMWGSPVTGLTGFSETALRFVSTRSPDDSYQDTGTVQAPAHIRAHPQPMSDSARWISFGDTSVVQQTVLFRMLAVSGAIVEITLDTQLADQQLQAPHPLTVAGATVGTLYWNVLDNTAPAAATVGPAILTTLGDVTPLLAFG